MSPTANRDLTCPACHGQVAAGEEIRWVKTGDRWIATHHPICPTGGFAPETASLPYTVNLTQLALWIQSLDDTTSISVALDAWEELTNPPDRATGQAWLREAASARPDLTAHVTPF